MKYALRFAAALALSLPAVTHAHDAWLVPSSTVLSGNDSWITVDASVGNDKFYFNHAPLRLDNLVIVSPSGKTVSPENANRGKLRSTFDLQLTEPGTYRIAVVNDGVFARWKEDGKPKRYFGKVENMAAAIPAQAQDLDVSESIGRVETFATAGKPTTLAAAARGLELVPVTHPNDLYADETATFQMTIDGKPAADLEVNIVPGGGRYRDPVGEIALKTDKEGKFEIKWPQPGLYWLEAGTEDQNTTVKDASKRRLSYVATLEVLAQ
ncbi:DUF4198 domain-containing protein [Bordetella sp. 15P40C-2]|uniref:DUF4198 domain-containing protein n=1 Tax=Bordetella sp. 15P40C-2 TaxID=2572246 RepID=UPI001322117B|nr:DUF4198 domain-containing protein [Bordetella sp. 15P40C-2]MVW73056.1 DUF4198 domain-containing protein [Bordetella sp. 15P40C-2]